MIYELINHDYSNFGLLVHVIRQNHVNRDSFNTLSILNNFGIFDFLSIFLQIFQPEDFDPKLNFNASYFLSKMYDNNFDFFSKEGYDQKFGFFKDQKKRIYILDLILSLCLLRQSLMQNYFFSESQKQISYLSFKQLVCWQILTKNAQEKIMINQILTMLLFDYVQENIIFNGQSLKSLNQSNFGNFYIFIFANI